MTTMVTKNADFFMLASHEPKPGSICHGPCHALLAGVPVGALQDSSRPSVSQKPRPPQRQPTDLERLDEPRLRNAVLVVKCFPPVPNEKLGVATPAHQPMIKRYLTGWCPGVKTFLRKIMYRHLLFSPMQR